MFLYLQTESSNIRQDQFCDSTTSSRWIVVWGVGRVTHVCLGYCFAGFDTQFSERATILGLTSPAVSSTMTEHLPQDKEEPC
jgi:hypothetical protein